MKKISEDNNIIEKFVMEILLEKQRARRWKIFFRFAWLGFFILLFSYVRVDHSSLSSTPHDAAFESGSKDNFAAVIELTGVIDSEQDSANKLISALEAAYHDPHTKGIIIRANSPGGSPVQAGIAFDEIKRLKKTIQPFLFIPLLKTFVPLVAITLPRQLTKYLQIKQAWLGLLVYVQMDLDL